MDSIFAFLAISAVVIATPGQDTALTIRNTILGGFGAGRATALGVAGGQLVWTVAAGSGVTALLVASESLFAIVRLAGAAYLIYLGATSLVSAVRTQADRVSRKDSNRSGLGTWAALRQGLLSNLGNPKMVVFFSTLLPQFAPRDGPTVLTMLGLGLSFCVMTMVWLSGYAWIVARGGDVLLRPVVRRALHGAMGAALVALGLRLASRAQVDR